MCQIAISKPIYCIKFYIRARGKKGVYGRTDKMTGSRLIHECFLTRFIQTPTNQHPVEAINQMAKSVSTPHIPAAAAGTVDNGNEEYVSTPSSKSS